MFGTRAFCDGRYSECMERQTVMGHQGPRLFYLSACPRFPSPRQRALPGLSMYSADTQQSPCSRMRGQLASLSSSWASACLRSERQRLRCRLVSDSLVSPPRAFDVSNSFLCAYSPACLCSHLTFSGHLLCAGWMSCPKLAGDCITGLLRESLLSPIL